MEARGRSAALFRIARKATKEADFVLHMEVGNAVPWLVAGSEQLEKAYAGPTEEESVVR